MRQPWVMKYRITRHDGEEDEITSQEFDNCDDAYELLEEIYGDICCSDADYEDRPYYEIVELKDWLPIKLCNFAWNGKAVASLLPRPTSKR